MVAPDELIVRGWRLLGVFQARQRRVLGSAGGGTRSAAAGQVDVHALTKQCGGRYRSGANQRLG
jgi:hypothetical protein